MLRKFLGQVTFNPISVSGVCIGLIPKILDWVQVYEDIWKYWKVVAFCIFLIPLMILLKFLGFFPDASNTYTSGNDQRSADTGAVKKSSSMEASVVSAGTYTISFFWKILVGLFLAVLILLLSSVYYLNSLKVHYINLGYFPTISSADMKIKRINKILRQKGEIDFRAVRRRRSIRDIPNNYMVCVNGGYLSEQEAQKDYAYLRDILKSEKILELKRYSSASLIRKIEYFIVGTKRKINNL